MVATNTEYNALQGWEDAQTLKLSLQTFLRSCAFWRGQDPETLLRWPAGRIADWLPVCEAAEKLRNATTVEIRSFFETQFQPVRVSNHDVPEGLFTGYYEAELRGSRTKDTKHRYPIYAKPDDFRRPYYSRCEIDHGALDGRGLELIYVDDPVELFFLHIQGSGRIKMDNGQTVRVGYAAQNGHEYTSVGALLADYGYLERKEITAPLLKTWIRENGQQGVYAMQHNASYIFFQELPDLEEDHGPVGAQTVPLTPGYSLAVDDDYIAYGVPIWLETTLPAEGGAAERPFRRLMIAQDTGGAIRGPVRGDIFFGHGAHATWLAGHMKHTGRYALLLPKARFDADGKIRE